jgi:hypothetical protein
MDVRAWLPIQPVAKAPLLLCNTTALYPSACARRAPAEPGKSPSWKIFGRRDFLADCAAFGGGADGGTCGWYHTLGMVGGEVLFFRNGEVMHGTATVGEDGGRFSLALDCAVDRQNEE